MGAKKAVNVSIRSELLDAAARRGAKLHVPDPRPMRDALIAATALVHSMTVVTRNVRGFEPMGVEILNPWEWEKP
jgi:predicted nucleic acid-binding protein